MKLSTWVNAMVALLLVVGVGQGVSLSDAHQARAAEAADSQRPAEPAKAPPREEGVDPYERNATLWASHRAGATSGWQRGQELYYMKCWMCHSEYVIVADPSPAPSLRHVAKRLTDEQIAMYVRNGTARMPAYRFQLSDADINDLLALFKEKCGTFPTGGGCFDEHNPPRNPLYRY